MDNILEALKQIDASNTTYEEWIQVGMALKAEGYDCSVWDTGAKTINAINLVSATENGELLKVPLYP